ncbi:hypothetical protein LTR10_013568 [Elasticomyces elasticus]|nr:hypothetical protein LTR10_013568 [Elasticomyces elasticus]
MDFVLQLREEISMHKQTRAQDDTTPDVLKPSFKLACDGLESNYVLSKGGPASRFKWFFNIYTPWYALAYVLRCLCSSPCGFETERAWALVEELFPRVMRLHGHSTGVHDEYGHGSIWKYLNMLRNQALSSRQHTQLSMATTDVGTQSSNNGEHCTSQLLSNSEISLPTGATATAQEISGRSELVPEFIADSSQSIFSPLDLSMPEFPFLPEWNAVINGCLNDDAYEMNPSHFANYPADAAQF